MNPDFHAIRSVAAGLRGAGREGGLRPTVGTTDSHGDGRMPGPPWLTGDSATASSVRDALESRAKTFAELMRALADDDGRGLVRELHDLVEGGQAELRDDGRWAAVTR
jgi:hypothetical protein